MDSEYIKEFASHTISVEAMRLYIKNYEQENRYILIDEKKGMI